MQSFGIALIAHCWSTITKVSVWQSYDTDHLIHVGNDAYVYMLYVALCKVQQIYFDLLFKKKLQKINFRS